MQLIRDNFINKITETATNAVGAYIILLLGINSHQQMTNSHPNATIHMGAGPPDAADVREISFAPTHQQTQNTFQSNRNILSELFFTEIIQYWFEFLLEIYGDALRRNMAGETDYPIPNAKPKIDFTLSGTDLTQNIENSACKEFDFLAASEKLRVIKTILGVNLTTIDADIKLLKTNIQVRNILQHRRGVVSEKDLSELGVHSIIEDHGNLTKEITADQKISRTVYDIENLVGSLIIIAKTLVA